MLAHELRNPLGAISSAVYLLRMTRPKQPAWQRALNGAERQIKHQVRLADGRLDGSRPDQRQVVSNLLNNAARFTDAGGQLTVRLTAGPERATVAVRDTGIGIEPEMLSHVFEPFTQV